MGEARDFDTASASPPFRGRMTISRDPVDPDIFIEMMTAHARLSQKRDFSDTSFQRAIAQSLKGKVPEPERERYGQKMIKRAAALFALLAEGHGSPWMVFEGTWITLAPEILRYAAVAPLLPGGNVSDHFDPEPFKHYMLSTAQPKGHA